MSFESDMQARLLQLQEELSALEETGREAAQTVELDQSRVGRLSRMDALQGQAMSKEAQRRRHLELQAIKAALQRLDEGDYGYCLACGEEIARPRLNVDPAARYCLACADKAEQPD